ncbi:hypothetical protein Csac_1399 [Caldicellulosiruptor saccharolyticus DSM 8903]|uniref:Uncharacterized protein n=1 Tax=Caldicellulosiruptor saccharolyticus (strain ATCC 43494 / DSM 8903 / Tp8T 6331) TaxID=351627 RepID=A4XJB6_CALS8|nr:hypothetical protein [Caldicellulosiruptor saccharolyticus]ABP67001.1 hypothetical protein Csac_1399 [Caldicellulosiruptor saccharolyticus DSM 8903]
MLQINEKDNKLFDMIVKFKMLPYDMAKKIYGGKWPAYKRIERLTSRGYLQKVNHYILTLGEAGIAYLEEVRGITFEPLVKMTAEEVIWRWQKVYEIGSREYILPHFISCWDFKRETRNDSTEMSDKNKILCVARGYGIYRISKEAGQKTISEFFTDIKEATTFGVEKFVVLCESKEKVEEFLAAEERIQNIAAKEINVLGYTQAGLKILDTIIGIPDYKEKILNSLPVEKTSILKNAHGDFETEDRIIHIGAGDIAAKRRLQALKAVTDKTIEIITLKGLEDRYKGLEAKIIALELSEFLKTVGYKESENR